MILIELIKLSLSFALFFPISWATNELTNKVVAIELSRLDKDVVGAEGFPIKIGETKTLFVNTSLPLNVDKVPV